MTIVLAVLFITEWLGFILLVLLFGALGFAEIARAAPSRKYDRFPSADSPGARMTRWHVVALMLVVGNALVLSFGLACEFATSDGCSNALDGIPLIVQYPAAELVAWLLAWPALYGPMYAVRLQRNRVRAAELIGLGMMVLPVSLFAIAQNFDPRTGSESTSMLATAGLALYALCMVLPRHWAKALVLSTSCIAMLVALSDVVGPTNPVWLLAVVAMGYTVFRAEWKHMASIPQETVRVFEPASVGQVDLADAPRSSLQATTIRAGTFLIVCVACIVALSLVWRTGFASEESAPAAVFAVAALAIAACGSLLTMLAPTAFGQARLEIDHAAATFVVVLVSAAVMHFIAAPPVMVDSYFGMAAGWKPVLVTIACIGALGITVTTLTARERQIRPFMIAIVLPAAFLLPSDTIFTFLRDDSFLVWTQRLIETGIIVAILAIMWFVYGPGRRVSSERSDAVTETYRDTEQGDNPVAQFHEMGICDLPAKSCVSSDRVNERQASRHFVADLFMKVRFA